MLSGPWFWLSPDPSHVAGVLRRLLTAAGTLPTGEVLAGLRRATRYHPARTARVPDTVMIDYLRSQHAYQTSGDQICLRHPETGLIDRTDRALLEAFSTRNIIELPTCELVRALVRSGRSPKTAEALIRTSPLLKRARFGVHALRRPPAPRALPG